MHPPDFPGEDDANELSCRLAMGPGATLEECARRLWLLPTDERAKGWLGSSPPLREPRSPAYDGLGG